MSTKIIFLSDTHNQHDQVSKIECDVLVHAGDMSMDGTKHELNKVNAWLKNYPARFKVAIAGNHDFGFENNSRSEVIGALIDSGVFYLEDSSVTIEGIKFWGSPYTPWFYDYAFNARRGPEIKQHWDKIPNDVDVLITHGPPYNILDPVAGDIPGLQERGHAGCKDLLDKVLQIKPKVHVFGHLHSGRGIKLFNGTAFINATVVDENYKVVYEPIEWEL